MRKLWVCIVVAALWIGFGVQQAWAQQPVEALEEHVQNHAAPLEPSIPAPDVVNQENEQENAQNTSIIGNIALPSQSSETQAEENPPADSHFIPPVEQVQENTFENQGNAFQPHSGIAGNEDLGNNEASEILPENQDQQIPLEGSQSTKKKKKGKKKKKTSRIKKAFNQFADRATDFFLGDDKEDENMDSEPADVTEEYYEDPEIYEDPEDSEYYEESEAPRITKQELRKKGKKVRGELIKNIEESNSTAKRNAQIYFTSFGLGLVGAELASLLGLIYYDFNPMFPAVADIVKLDKAYFIDDFWKPAVVTHLASVPLTGGGAYLGGWILDGKAKTWTPFVGAAAGVAVGGLLGYLLAKSLVPEGFTGNEPVDAIIDSFVDEVLEDALQGEVQTYSITRSVWMFAITPLFAAIGSAVAYTISHHIHRNDDLIEDSNNHASLQFYPSVSITPDYQGVGMNVVF